MKEEFDMPRADMKTLRKAFFPTGEGGKIERVINGWKCDFYIIPNPIHMQLTIPAQKFENISEFVV